MEAKKNKNGKNFFVLLDEKLNARTGADKNIF
jgi:hypothetical protein